MYENDVSEPSLESDAIKRILEMEPNEVSVISETDQIIEELFAKEGLKSETGNFTDQNAAVTDSFNAADKSCWMA